MRRRGLAAAAVVTGLAALAGLTVSTWPNGVGGYVSEAGVAGGGYADLYRTSVLGVALTGVLVALALWRSSRPAAVALGLAAPAIATSAAVTCTSGCPLPPFAHATAQDLVHAGATVTGVGCCALAMYATGRWTAGPLSRVGRAGVALAWPLLIATTASVLLLGRGTATGVLERLALLACLVWMLVAAACPVRPLPTGTTALQPGTRPSPVRRSRVAG